MADAIFNFDSAILLFIQTNIRTNWLTPIVEFITHLGDAGIFWIALGIVLLIYKKTRRTGLIMLLCLLGAFVVNDLILKPLIARPRPFDTVPGLVSLVYEDSFSFPSGHTSSSFACALPLALLLGRKKGILAYVLATLIALSRLYVGIHYPTDVIGGVVIGTLVSWGVFVIANKFIPDPLTFRKAPPDDGKQDNT